MHSAIMKNREQHQEDEMTSNVVTAVNYGGASCLSLYVIPKRPSRDLEGPKRVLPPFKGEHLEQGAN
jgi:hypothetical protein